MPLRPSEQNLEILASVSKALDVLEVFTHESPEMALGDIAAKLNMGKSTVHKLLQTLLFRGFIAQDPITRRYRLGLRNWQLGSIAAGQLNVRGALSPYLHAIADLTGEQITLWVYEAGWAVCVDRIDSRHRIRSYTRMGTVEKPEDFASGRCLLAFSDDAEVNKAVQRVIVEGGVKGKDLLIGRLIAIRERGYETNPGDLWEEIRAIAAPVFSHKGLAASISVSGPESRFDEHALQEMLPHLMNQVHRASEQLGFIPGEKQSIAGEW